MWVDLTAGEFFSQTAVLSCVPSVYFGRPLTSFFSEETLTSGIELRSPLSIGCCMFACVNETGEFFSEVGMLRSQPFTCFERQSLFNCTAERVNLFWGTFCGFLCSIFHFFGSDRMSTFLLKSVSCDDVF